MGRGFVGWRMVVNAIFIDLYTAFVKEFTYLRTTLLGLCFQ